MGLRDGGGWSVNARHPARRAPMVRWALAATATFALLTAACGSSGTDTTTASTAAPSTVEATTTTTTMPTTVTTAAPGITLVELAGKFGCTNVTPDPMPREGTVESGTCTYKGQKYEIATFPPGTSSDPFEHPNLCETMSVESIVTPKDESGPQWEVAPATKVDAAAIADIASALDGQIALVQC